MNSTTDIEPAFAAAAEAVTLSPDRGRVALPVHAIDTGTGPRLVMEIAGPSRIVFEKKRDACEPNDIPDAPARAIRADDAVQLYATHFHNRRMLGPDLLHVKLDCRVVFQGGEKDDPAAFDDRGWITSLYTRDGRTIYAAIHNEYQGHRRKELCATGRYIDCWYNSITAAVSHDSGLHFVRATSGSDLIAALPYRYDEVVGHHSGYFNPSNIVSLGGALYMTVFTTQVRDQQPGNCLLRTDRVEDSSAWRAWDGNGFGVTFVNPYDRISPARRPVCTPIGKGRLLWPVTSLVRHRGTGLFMALMMNGGRDGGVFYATSPDLLRWSEPAKLLDGIGESAFKCGDSAPIAYPSLLDPAAPGRTFDSVAGAALLYLTKFNISDCKTSMDRDLIQIPVSIK